MASRSTSSLCSFQALATLDVPSERYRSLIMLNTFGWVILFGSSSASAWKNEARAASSAPGLDRVVQYGLIYWESTVITGSHW